MIREWCEENTDKFKFPAEGGVNCGMFCKENGNKGYILTMEETVEGMLSSDYKERFKAEYQQTKIRYEKLKAFNNRIEAGERYCFGGGKTVEAPKHDCPFELLMEQQHVMGQYLHILEVRAVIEGINLNN